MNEEKEDEEKERYKGATGKRKEEKSYNPKAMLNIVSTPIDDAWEEVKRRNKKETKDYIHYKAALKIARTPI